MNNKNLKLVFLFLLPLFLFIIARILLKYNPYPICFWKNITGFDCPGCGITRAFHSLCLLKFKEAYAFNNKIFIIIPLLFYLWIKEIVKVLKSKN